MGRKRRNKEAERWVKLPETRKRELRKLHEQKVRDAEAVKGLKYQRGSPFVHRAEGP